tara:strand:+ start:738 stop:1172 length:435 start_codon:yes stop_codon:yes gene_type:complete
MKSFKDFQNISEKRTAVGARTTPVNAPSDSDHNLNDITNDEVVARINRFCGAIADMEHINPNAAVNTLKTKLHGLGIEMLGELPEMADKSGSVSIPLSAFGGIYGKTGEEPAGEVKNDDGVKRSLKLKYETLSNGACKVYAELA